MGEGSTHYHEPIEELSDATRDMHRALVSLQEELEAVDWYQQRADACRSKELRAVLLHNLKEEIEHASMTLEWIRRQHPAFDETLRTYLFTEAPLVEVEEQAENDAPSEPGRRLTVGTLKKGNS